MSVSQRSIRKGQVREYCKLVRWLAMYGYKDSDRVRAWRFSAIALARKLHREFHEDLGNIAEVTQFGVQVLGRRKTQHQIVERLPPMRS
jgi:hypothetical protein